MPGWGNSRECLSKLKATPHPTEIDVTCKSPVGDISAVTLIRTDTTLDHSQKAEKVCSSSVRFSVSYFLWFDTSSDLFWAEVVWYCWMQVSVTMAVRQSFAVSRHQHAGHVLLCCKLDRSSQPLSEPKMSNTELKGSL